MTMTRAYSTWQLPTYQIIGPRLRVHWDTRLETAGGDLMGAEELTYYSAAEVVLPINCDRSTMVAAIEAAGGPAEDLADGWFPPAVEEAQA
mgnify:CR=1 FL=1